MPSQGMEVAERMKERRHVQPETGHERAWSRPARNGALRCLGHSPARRPAEGLSLSQGRAFGDGGIECLSLETYIG